MKFDQVIKEGRAFKFDAVNTIKQRKENKAAFLRACGYDATYDLMKDELLVVLPNKEIVNIFNDTSALSFTYKNDEAKEKWTKFYKKLFPGENKRAGVERGTVGDFLKNAYLKNKLKVYDSLYTYKQFINDLAKDVNVVIHTEKLKK